MGQKHTQPIRFQVIRLSIFPGEIDEMSSNEVKFMRHDIRLSVFFPSPSGYSSMEMFLLKFHLQSF